MHVQYNVNFPLMHMQSQLIKQTVHVKFPVMHVQSQQTVHVKFQQTVHVKFHCRFSTSYKLRLHAQWSSMAWWSSLA